jgi:hypothetical protein
LRVLFASTNIWALVPSGASIVSNPSGRALPWRGCCVRSTCQESGSRAASSLLRSSNRSTSLVGFSVAGTFQILACSADDGTYGRDQAFSRLTKRSNSENMHLVPYASEQVLIWNAKGIPLPAGDEHCCGPMSPGATNGATGPTDSSRSQPISISRKPLEIAPHSAQPSRRAALITRRSQVRILPPLWPYRLQGRRGF